MKEELSGGREGKIHKMDNKVFRPSNSWTKAVHDFLNFMHSQNLEFVPKVLSLNESLECVSFMPGEVYNYPLPSFFLSDDMLISASSLLKNFHKYGHMYIKQLNGHEQWMLPIQQPVEVMCHGDFAPYNVTIQNNKASGIIDFDTLKPGPIMSDIAYAIYRWVPFTNPNNPDSYSDLKGQIKRANVFMHNYGLSKSQRGSLVDFMIKRLEDLVNYMRVEAANGNLDFQANIEAGHMQLYIDDIAYFKNNRDVIMKAVQE
ncbi:MAG: aminoglycoside phosphotransferase family protein [Saccharospirillaceae bacterium]|nr:aminoglycoside phosphotransferase family protein [Pseudomonadales bacterium]NRB79208.1 aminoglycoside phosphotransferase family protein [Saccharospirillaceae bacterium]